MEHFFTYIDIENFKSIKKLRIDGCKRINLFIGPPNVGKSNILEALSVFSLPITHRTIKDIIRFENIPELYFSADSNKAISFKSNKFSFQISLNKDFDFLIEYFSKDISIAEIIIKQDFKSVSYSRKLGYDEINVNKYVFSLHEKTTDRNNYNRLSSPFGNNLFSVIRANNLLVNHVAKILENQGLKLLFDTSTNSYRIISEIVNDSFFSIPYNGIADTFQRYIFHLAAIKSNSNSILLFEEPEANCYPPYIKALTQEIVESETNQFFIATHSDIVVNHFLENAFDETNIYMVDFKDGQTVVQTLTEQQKLDIVNDGIDIFFNRDYFLTSNNL